MARPPAWTYTLDEARRQAPIAVDFYNRPGDRRSYADFIVHIHLAWQNLLHADRMRRKLEIYFRERDGRRTFVRNPDGSKKTWDLAKCLKQEFDENSPVRRNIEFFIGLRNRIEHRFEASILDATASEAHACIINFEAELVRRFGQSKSLGEDLKFPLSIQSLSPTRFEEARALRRNLPLATKTYITQFEESLPAKVRDDPGYSFRLVLLPMMGPKTGADMALTFVRQEELTDEERNALTGQQASVIVAEKLRDAALGDEVLPSNAVSQVEELIEFKFSISDFTKLRKRWEIGPVKTGSKEQLPKSHGYCLYSPPFKQFVYTQKLVKRMADALSDPLRFESLLGRPPIPKETGSPA